MATWGMRSTAEPRWPFHFMKVSEMTREQLRDHMKAARIIHRFDADVPEWKHAFKLARLSGKENLDMDCSFCIKTVKEWLEA